MANGLSARQSYEVYALAHDRIYDYGLAGRLDRLVPKCGNSEVTNTPQKAVFTRLSLLGQDCPPKGLSLARWSLPTFLLPPLHGSTLHRNVFLGRNEPWLPLPQSSNRQ